MAYGDPPRHLWPGYQPTTTSLPYQTYWAGTPVQVEAVAWNGPICHTCRKPYLGICVEDHGPYVATGYEGKHRN